MPNENNAVSIRPSDFVEGGAVPVDRFLTWKECRFNLFEYTKKSGEVVATTTAARLKMVDDDGQEFEQQYSAADPERFVPSDDGKTLVAVGAAQALSKSSNFYLMMNALINAGFPENKLTGDISVLDGLETFNIGVPEPKRSGLVRVAAAEGEPTRERVISVPSQIRKLPWEKKGAKSAAPAAKGKTAAAKVETEEAAGEDVIDTALALAAKVVAKGDATRQKIAAAAFRDLRGDPNKDAVATLIFKPEFAAALVANGYTVDGENVTKEG